MAIVLTLFFDISFSKPNVEKYWTSVYNYKYYTSFVDISMQNDLEKRWFYVL